MAEPWAYFITWTTYGSWLPGDERGCVESGREGVQTPDEEREEGARRKMKEARVVLDGAQRGLVERTVREHCEIRGWALRAVNVRTKHVHLVVTAPQRPEEVMRQLKAWCSRGLTERARREGMGDSAARRSGTATSGARSKHGMTRWWTEHGSTKWINDEGYLARAVKYVMERQ